MKHLRRDPNYEYPKARVFTTKSYSHTGQKTGAGDYIAPLPASFLPNPIDSIHGDTRGHVRKTRRRRDLRLQPPP